MSFRIADDEPGFKRSLGILKSMYFSYRSKDIMHFYMFIYTIFCGDGNPAMSFEKKCFVCLRKELALVE